jgi:hypothetical protein
MFGGIRKSLGRGQNDLSDSQSRGVDQMTLFSDATGPYMRYDNGVLHISDLNPQQNMYWNMSRWEMFCVGLRCIWSSLRRLDVRSLVRR